MKCITISYGRVKGKAKNYPYYQPCMYEQYITKDGRKVWKLYKVLGTAHRSERLAREDAMKYCRQYHLAYESGIRQWMKVKI